MEAAKSGKKAAEIVISMSFDCILMDIGLPYMSSVDAMIQICEKHVNLD